MEQPFDLTFMLENPNFDQNATDGWTYHSMETITVTEKPGCMQTPIPTNYYMLIFEKEF